MDGPSTGLRRATSLGPEGIVDELIRAGLRDRDLESLPVGERMGAHAEAGAVHGAAGPAAALPEGDAKRLVCDCVDAEPGLEVAQHLLAHHAAPIVEGAVIVAHATSTPRIILHVGESDPAGAQALADAVEAISAESETRGLPAVEIVRAPFRPDLRGYERVPTLVVTAETLLAVARVLRGDAEEFRASGTAESPGSKFFQVTGAVNRPGIFELPLGASLRQVIQEVCGGVAEGETLQAVIVGGTKGGLYTGDELDLPLDFDSVRRSGGIIGSGAIAVLGERDCIIDQTKQRISVSCYETCGKCSLGREGSYQLSEIVTDMTRGRSRPGDLELLREIAETMRIGCACATGRTAPNLILSGLDRFGEEYEAHSKRKRCKALVCAKYVTYHILPALCDGCGACAEECPEDAIAGGRRKIHVIDQDDCEQCGRCYEVCLDLQKAVVKAGSVKPRTPKRPIPVGSWED